MLKRSILVLFAMAIAAQASAKVVGTEWGLTAGVRYDIISFDKNTGLSLSPNITYNVGLHTSLVFLGLAIQPELNYGYTAIKVKTMVDGGKNTDTKVKAHDLEVPVLLSLRLLPVIRFNAGVVFNILNKATYERQNEVLMFGPIHPSVGYAAGISLCFGHKVLIDARFVGYFNKSLNEFNPFYPPIAERAVTFNMKSCSAGIKIGYLF